MAVEIYLAEKTYVLDYNRKQALQTFNKLDKASDTFEVAEIILGDAFIKNHADLSEIETKKLVDEIFDNYAVGDRVKMVGEELKVVEKGLLTVVNEILQGVIPKGFTQNAPKRQFRVI